MRQIPKAPKRDNAQLLLDAEVNFEKESQALKGFYNLEAKRLALYVSALQTHGGFSRPEAIAILCSKQKS